VGGRDIYLLDFSFKSDPIRRLISFNRSVTVIDHHGTADQELSPLVQSDDKFRLIFDNSKCGARLAWEYFRPGEPAPFLIDVVQDRDLWTWKLPESRALNAWLGVQERTFYRWSSISLNLGAPYLDLGLPASVAAERNLWVYDRMEYVEQGKAILAYQQKVIESHVRHATEREIAGYKVLVANATTLGSEITGELAQGRPFGATFRDDLSRGMRIWSLRSREGGIDVSEIARSLGGGGHRGAAGFQEELPS
jgi:oligoribonuclease NrnB/cAMP/cGMP phosphodiesterase (DHH superfamily)